MHASMPVMHGLPTVPAMLTNREPGASLTLNELPRSERRCVVSASTPFELDTSEIRTHAYLPSSSKYLGSSIGRGDAPRFTTDRRLICAISQCAGTWPSHSMP